MDESFGGGDPDVPHVPGVRHRYLSVRGSQLHLAETGVDGSPVLLLLHGFPQNWFAWREVLTAFGRDRHVVALDLPGAGWSQPSRHGYSTTERSRVVVAVLEELGIDKADIAGHDWGAWLAFRVALEAPDRVRRLVGISELHPWPLQRRLVPNLWRMWVTALFETPGIGASIQRRRRAIRWFLSRDASDPGLWTDELVDAYGRVAADRERAQAGQQLHAAFVRHDIIRLVLRRDHRREFATPTLLIAGEQDAYVPPRLMALPRRRSEVVRVQTISGGHFLLDENPAGVIEGLRSHFLGRRESPQKPDCTPVAASDWR